MRAEDQREMRLFYIESEKAGVRNSLMKEFTRANIITLFIWLAVSFGNGLFDLVFWLKLFAVFFSLLLSGLFSDWLWFWILSGKFQRPLSPVAYLTRLPFYLIVTAGIAVPVALAVNMIAVNRLIMILYICGAQVVFQIINQWIIFNRLRKLSLTEL